MKKAKLLAIICTSFVIAFGALTFFSYRRLLTFEHKLMPDISTLPTPHVRRVYFRISPIWSASWLPHWTVTYHEQPVLDTEYIDPSLTIDIFGRIADAESKEVHWSVERYKQGKE